MYNVQCRQAGLGVVAWLAFRHAATTSCGGVMGNRVFSVANFKGLRFSGGVLPVRVAVELQTFEAIIREIARSLFLRDNPKRKRAPQYDKEFVLALAGRLEDGSCVAQVVNAGEDPDYPLTGNPLFDRAHDIFNQTLRAIADERELPDEFPRDILPEMPRVGHRLHDDESIIYESQNEVSPPIDLALRRRIRERSGLKSRVATFVGRVIAADRGSRRFELHRARGGRLPRIPFGPFKPEIMEAFIASETHRVRIEVLGLYLDDELKRVEDLRNFESLPSLESIVYDADKLEREGQELASMDILWDSFNDALQRGDFDVVDRALHDIETVDEIAIDVLVTILTITAPAQQLLPHRRSFFERVSASFAAREALDDDLLTGLDG